MNKQQLIDKAIDDLGGVWPQGNPNVIHIGVDCLMGDRCTRHEFEARKVEREAVKKAVDVILSIGSEPEQHWYDYENQKALRLPPVGEVVLFGLNDNRRKVVIIAHDLNAAILRDETCHDDDVDYYAAAQELFRPLDWGRSNHSKELSKIIDDGIRCSHGGIAATAESLAKAILAASYRKCHNKTPSDKE